MEKRYLFRGKRSDTGEWVEWNMITGIPHDVHILDNTICQCTGVEDKNGKLIWENDIVKEFNSSGDEWNLSQIVFGEYSLNLGWCAKGIKTLHEYSRRLFNVGFGTSEAGKCEAIGNIFDNPELLEV